MKRLPLRLILATALLLPFPAKMQAAFNADSLVTRFDTFVSWCAPEKLYVHVDRTYYTAGETIWFTGWLQNASRASLHPTSNYIYAEMINSRGEVSIRVKIKKSSGVFPGCIELPDNMASGEYTFRAYTLWQLNNSAEYHFNQRIKILGAKEGPAEKKASAGEDIDINFYPEGGRYFAGCRSIIGFKVMNQEGKSTDFSGWLFSADGTPIQPVSTRHDGMGVLEFLPEQGVSYHLESASGKKYPIPAPSEDGATLNIRRLSKSIFASVRGFGGGTARLLVRDIDAVRILAEVPLDGKAHSFKADDIFFQEGINHFLLIDQSGAILSERLFYSSGDGSGNAVCNFSVNDLKPAARALIGGKLTLRDAAGNPLDGSCSVSVVRGSLRHWQQDEGIVAYMRLSSELRGHINKPDYYFDPAVPARERSENLDLLLMIQGWSYYDLPNILRTDGAPFEIRHLKEYTQSVHGRITRRSSSKVPRKFIFSVFIPKMKAQTFINVEEGSSYLIDSLEFEENTEFLINVGTSRIGATYLPKWDGDVFAPSYTYFPAPGKVNAVREEEKIPLQTEEPIVDTLNAAVVTATPEEWDSVLMFGRSVSDSDLKAYRDRTLIEYLNIKMPTFIYNGEGMYNRNARRSALGGVDDDDEESGLSMSSDEDTGQGAVKLLVDETQQAWWGYDMVRMEEIESISISTEPDPLWGGEGGIVSIKLKASFSPASFGRDPTLLYFVPLGYQTPRHFYAPRYDRGDGGPFDKRNTVHWAPCVSVKGGFAYIPFCNTDQMDYPYIVRIEGRTSSGIPFSHHCILDLKEE